MLPVSARDITGFLIVRDVVRNGYPFLEAIFASLGLCRTVHVLDGESADTTWASLTGLQDIVGSDRLVLNRAKWQTRGRTHILAAATNQLRAKLASPPGAWLWNFQANEIVAPKTASEIRFLLRQHREIDLFRLPFTTLMGFHYLAYTDYRGRLFRNLPRLVSIGDAYDCGFDLASCRRRPWRLLWFLRNRRRWAPGHLAHPVLRLRAPFPEHYSVKMMTRASLNPWESGAAREAAAARATLEQIRAVEGTLAEFWEQTPFARDADPFPKGPIPPERRVPELPPVLRHLSVLWRYDPELSLSALAGIAVPSPDVGGAVST